MVLSIKMDYLYSRLPLIYVFMSGLGFSIQTLIVKLLSERGFKGSFACVLARGVLQLVMSSMFIYFDSERRANNGPPLFGSSSFIKWMLFFRSVLGYAGVAFSFLSVEYIPMGDSTTLTMLSPLFASIGSYFALGESWRFPEFAAAIMSLTGASLIAKPSFLFGAENSESNTPAGTMGIFFGLVSAVGAGGAYMFVRILGTTAKMPWANVCFAQALGQIFLSIPCFYLFNQSIPFDLPWFEYGLILLSGTVGAVSQAAMTVGMQREKSASATGMRMSDVVFGFIWQAAFTNDAISWLSVLGAFLVSSGVLTIVIFKQADSSNSSSSSSSSNGDDKNGGANSGGAMKGKSSGNDENESDARTDLETTSEDVEMVRPFHDQKIFSDDFFDQEPDDEDGRRKLITLSHSIGSSDREDAVDDDNVPHGKGMAALSSLSSIISARLRRTSDSTVTSNNNAVNKSKSNVENKSLVNSAMYTSLPQNDHNLTEN